MTERCPTCGLARPLWTKPEVIEALRAWAGRHGRAPYQSEWKRPRPDRPGEWLVTARFGSWTAAIDAAGLVRPATSGHQSGWTRDKIIRALRAWNLEHGQPPTSREWHARAEGRPTYDIVRHRFGSWHVALRLAGLAPRPRKRAAA